ncbi:hypothetical protein OJF2_03090 [Aquisphaera giovannonii]|uniref:Uncharacterized protein n=1 Tax=Aquisphaera giovannonii TaxID=406548 RepID=A0A5B9VUT6_9BACT|nr:hypothetical protein [Aquisphaera giovannonii]QEH31844.1 hypothetical protein OJF2_03090 [Aquisphaera giovannonii]
MKTETVDLAGLAELIEGLRREVGRLGERVAALEASAPAAAPAPVPPPAGASATHKDSKNDRDEVEAEAPAAATAPAGEGLSEETVLVIASAIAAFLGKRAHIRQIRLIRSDAWAQQGRVTIQASHALSTLR